MTVQGLLALILFLAGVVLVVRAYRTMRLQAAADDRACRPPAWPFQLRHPIVTAIVGVPLVVIGGNSLPAFPLLRAPLLELVGRYDTMRPIDADSTCGTMDQLAYSTVDPRGEEGDGGPARCGMQSVVNSGAGHPDATVPVATCWPDTTAVVTADPPLCYKLGFLEFDEAGQLRSQAQLNAIRRVYSQGREIYTIAYVHGWRHDAQFGDKDVRRLRVAASYASSHLLERCRVAREHCGAVVLAVFVAWPGSIGLADGDAKAWAALNLLTFASRKNLSDRVGGAVLARLSELYSASHAAGAHPSNKTLLLGHSLGGNVLVTAATPGLVSGLERVAADLKAGGVDAVAHDRLGLPADLTVLLNPASEAAKLDQLRQTEAKLFATRTTRGSALPTFPDTTPPRLVILSASCGDLQMVRAGPDNHGVKCDSIVGTAFWASQVAEGRWGELERTGIGHVPPRSSSALRRLANMTLETNYQARGLPGFYDRGAFAGSGIRPWFSWRTTSYANARNRLVGTCLPEPAWLVCARRRGTRTDLACKASDQADRWQPWTAGDGSGGEVTLDRFAERGAPGQSNVQFQYGLARLGTGDWRVESQRADPIWAVQADLTAIAGHSQIASAPLLCAFNKLLLDDVVATDGRQPNDMLQAARKAWEVRVGGTMIAWRNAVAAHEARWLMRRQSAIFQAAAAPSKKD